MSGTFTLFIYSPDRGIASVDWRHLNFFAIFFVFSGSKAALMTPVLTHNAILVLRKFNALNKFRRSPAWAIVLTIRVPVSQGGGHRTIGPTPPGPAPVHVPVHAPVPGPQSRYGPANPGDPTVGIATPTAAFASAAGASTSAPSLAPAALHATYRAATNVRIAQQVEAETRRRARDVMSERREPRAEDFPSDDRFSAAQGAQDQILTWYERDEEAEE